MRKVYLTIMFYAMLTLLANAVNGDTATHQKHVLYISSYSPSFPTFFQQVEGIRSVFNGKNIILDIEFMDSRRFPGDDSVRLFNQMLKAKITRLPRYDAIIVADDAALNYAMGQRDGLFRNIPVFFCGINNMQLALSFGSGTRMRGAVEAVSMRETLEVVKRIFPQRKKLALVTDGSLSAMADFDTFRYDSRGLDFDVTRFSLDQMTFDQFYYGLDKLGSEWTILLLSGYTDITGKTLLFDEVLAGIMQNSKVPVFHLWEHGLGSGIFGGKIISHFEQGRSAALMVNDLFSGVPMSAIKIQTESPNKYMFDYVQLERFGISGSDLPQGSIIINKPHSFIELHPFATFAALLGIIFLLMVIGLLFYQRYRLAVEVKHRTRELFKTNQRLYAAMKNANQTLWEWNIVNDDFLLITSREGASPEGTATKGDLWKERMHPDDRDLHLQVLERYLKKEVPTFEVIHRIRNLDEVERWFITRGMTAERDENGRTIVISGISTDITDVKTFEAEISSSRTMLQTVLDSIPMGVFWKDTELVYTGCNDQFARSAMLSSPEDIKGKRDSDLVWKDQAALHESIDKDVISTVSRKGFYEEEIISPAGEKRYLRKLKTPLTDMNGKVFGILGVQEDVTEARMMREQRIRMQKLESVGILAGGLAHDFNNMLMAISGSLAVLKLREQDAKKLHWINLAEQSCTEAAEVTSRLITFARGGDPVKRSMNISELVKSVVSMDNPSETLVPRIVTCEGMGRVMADERQIGQVLRNLIENAREAVADEGSITIACRMADEGTAVKAGLNPGNYVQVSVNDNGRGIESENLGKIFDPYYSTKDMGTQKGQGLGLTVCHSVIKNHGGAIFAESDSAAGTTLTFLLPAI